MLNSMTESQVGPSDAWWSPVYWWGVGPMTHLHWLTSDFVPSLSILGRIININCVLGNLHSCAMTSVMGRVCVTRGWCDMTTWLSRVMCHMCRVPCHPHTFTMSLTQLARNWRRLDLNLVQTTTFSNEKCFLTDIGNSKTAVTMFQSTLWLLEI